MFRRMRLLFLAAMGKGYPPVIFIEAGEDPTKNRLPMIAPINIGLIITIVVFACATPTLALGMYPIFFPPKPTATPTITPTVEGESTMESTAEATIEPTATLTETPTPIVIVITATPTETNTPTATWTSTSTPTPTATGELWPIWMTATQFQRDMNPPPNYTPIVMTIKETVVVTAEGAK